MRHRVAMKAPRRLPRLRDPQQAAHHLADIVNPRFYARHTLLVVLCGPGSEPTHHLEVVECPDEPTPSSCADVLDNILTMVLDDPATSPTTGLALAITRPGSEQVQPLDRVWFRALHRVCHTRGLLAHGVYVVGSHGARAIHIDDAA